MNNEIKELKEENDRLEGELDAYKNTEYDDIQTIKELKEENETLKKDLLFQRKISFWRMSETYAGMTDDTLIHSDEWIEEMKMSMEEYYCSSDELGGIDELLKEYKDWIGYHPSEEEEDSEVESDDE
mgnify:CR=1 FL=1